MAHTDTHVHTQRFSLKIKDRFEDENIYKGNLSKHLVWTGMALRWTMPPHAWGSQNPV